MYIHCASQRLSLGTTLKICSIIIICKLNNLSEHAFKLDPPISSKKECLAFSSQFCPEVRFLIDSSSYNNKKSCKRQNREWFYLHKL